MSVLIGKTIRELVAGSDLVRLPGGSGRESLSGLCIQPVSIDVHLESVAHWTGERIVGEQWGVVTPGEGAFLLGTTREIFRMPDNIVGLVVGKSSVGRAGMMVECAGLIDPGFEGEVTLELANLLPQTGLPLCHGMRIAQVMFMWTSGAVPEEELYGGPRAGSHYQGQRGPTPSHLADRLQ